MEPITNDMDMIDSMDIIDRIEELEDETDTDRNTNVEQEELESLKDIINQTDGYRDFENGEGLIHEDYFTEYCQELCEDAGDLPRELPWYIENHIDWNGVARELKQDYVEVDFDGVSYFMRA